MGWVIGVSILVGLMLMSSATCVPPSPPHLLKERSLVPEDSGHGRWTRTVNVVPANQGMEQGRVTSRRGYIKFRSVVKI